MFKSLLLLSAAVLFLGGSSIKSSDVYICDSPNAERYHLTKTCRGLSNCKHEIVSVTKETATSRGLTLCGFEK